jgi:hypothetical protein
MGLVCTRHWTPKRRIRKDISDDMVEYAIGNSSALPDKNWPDAPNAIMRIPPHGRLLKVVYRQIGRKTYKVITAYWLD